MSVPLTQALGPMEMLRNVSRDGSWPIEGDVFFPLFDRDIRFAVEDEAELDYAERCAHFLASLPSPVVEKLCQASIRYCHEFQQSIGEDPTPFANVRDVLRLVFPSTLLIPNPPPDKEPVLSMELNCDWEREHGMEWVVRDDTVLYVGAFQGTDPWADFSEKESWNFA